MIIRKTGLEELDNLMAIYNRARQFMQETGNGNQWINGYPSREVILADIENGYSYVCLDAENEIVATFYFRIGEDPTYARIDDGKWLNDEPYGVVHRLAGSGKVKDVGSYCLQWCFDQIPNIRVDTHHDNVVMQHILKKNGFLPCGIIYVSNGTTRIAFQKIGNKKPVSDI